MQVDHIDENTIRVKISKDELAERGIRMLDMLNNRSKIQNFFYSILSEVDTDHSFDSGAPVSFQVMPNTSGLELLITKVRDDDTFSKMLGNNDDDSLQGHGFDDLDEPPTHQEVERVNHAFKPRETGDQAKSSTKRAYRFNDLSTVIELADNLHASDLASNLYYDQGKYFIELAFVSDEYQELKPIDAWAIANEYGIKINKQEMQNIKRVGKCLMHQDALGNIRHYFINKQV
ncbi:MULTISPECIES: adaptor protein MecA [Lactobacillus]|uniref:Adaptor protein MecA n=1 Tax=Lactobacillus xujianguonis TaxID=2495899 RepID=A0A437SWJ9_9LACO|nr:MULTISPECIES: adaptor protein MecA [Lactobacillus]RVU71299.1 adaptor protein MecA [Lactobacillus xujianguonis]RVU74002.1 adaptor protein MecA [Lactobacillus xujianguonis]